MGVISVASNRHNDFKKYLKNIQLDDGSLKPNVQVMLNEFLKKIYNLKLRDVNNIDHKIKLLWLSLTENLKGSKFLVYGNKFDVFDDVAYQNYYGLSLNQSNSNVKINKSLNDLMLNINDCSLIAFQSSGANSEDALGFLDINTINNRFSFHCNWSNNRFYSDFGYTIDDSSRIEGFNSLLNLAILLNRKNGQYAVWFNENMVGVKNNWQNNSNYNHTFSMKQNHPNSTIKNKSYTCLVVSKGFLNTEYLNFYQLLKTTLSSNNMFIG